jgi:predicted RNase H-like HicB family nuclease
LLDGGVPLPLQAPVRRHHGNGIHGSVQGSPEGYIAFVEELAGANTQGATLEEARENLREAVELVLESNRALAREEVGTGKAIREPLKIAG